MRIRLFQYMHGIGHMSRKRREALLYTLLITYICINILVYTHNRALGCRYMKPGLSHQRQKTRGFKRNCLSSRVRSRHYQKSELASQTHAYRHHAFRIYKRMSCLLKVNASVPAELRLHASYLCGKQRLRKYHVQLFKQLYIVIYGIGIGHEALT